MELKRLNRNQFNKFCDFIYEQSGIRIGHQKLTLLSNRIRRRLKAGEFDSFDAYYCYLTSPDGTSELERFLDTITTNETFFFRTTKHFEWLQKDLLTELVTQYQEGQRPSSLRIWSAGCASGAEPYSIAICLAENSSQFQEWSFNILGTDISEEILGEARAGIYKSKVIEAVTPRQRRLYFQHESANDLWKLRTEIKKRVEFRNHNLMEPLPAPPFDCIFISNVLIYFDRSSKEVVIENLIRALKVGGYLVVGPSEGIYDMLQPLEKCSTFIYQKNEETRASASVHRRGRVG